MTSQRDLRQRDQGYRIEKSKDTWGVKILKRNGKDIHYRIWAESTEDPDMFNIRGYNPNRSLLNIKVDDLAKDIPRHEVGRALRTYAEKSRPYLPYHSSKERRAS